MVAGHGPATSGTGLSDTRIADPGRRDRMLLVSGSALPTVLGAAGEAVDIDLYLEANTVKQRTVGGRPRLPDWARRILGPGAPRSTLGRGGSPHRHRRDWSKRRRPSRAMPLLRPGARGSGCLRRFGLDRWKPGHGPPCGRGRAGTRSEQAIHRRSGQERGVGEGRRNRAGGGIRPVRRRGLRDAPRMAIHGRRTARDLSRSGRCLRASSRTEPRGFCLQSSLRLGVGFAPR